MIKLILKIIWLIIAVVCILLSIYFLFAANGIEIFESLFSDGIWNGIKDFFVGIWEGFKETVGL